MVIFVGIVVVSLFLAFLVTSFFHRDKVESLAVESMIAEGKKMIDTYRRTPSAEMASFMDRMAGISGSVVQIFDPRGQPMLAGAEHSVPADAGSVGKVLSGGVIRNLYSGDHRPIIGIPFEEKGRPHALFIMLRNDVIWQEISKALRTIFILVLVFGSLFILAAARHIVKPLQRLTTATKRMATGRFDVDVRTRRKDEIGQLTASFNQMAVELAKLDRMRRDFVANVSHEIQTPLTSITGFTKALRQKTLDEESRDRYLKIIDEESGRLSRLSSNLLRLSSLQNESRPRSVGLYRLDEQIRKAVIALEPQWAAKELDLGLDLLPVSIEADEDLLGQVWINLLGNGIKFTPANGAIRVRMTLDAERISVTVADTGIGIPEEERQEIFKPFYTVDPSRDRSKGGNGLGLSIVKQIVELHRGGITVTGGQGEGAVFTVTLPLQMKENP